MKKKSSKKSNNSPEWIDVHNDELMISLGLRLPDYIVPDFSKTDKEKELLKKLRTKNIKYYSAHKVECSNIPCYDKLIVYTRRKTNSTCSYKCYQYQIKDIISVMHPDTNNIVKYSWNGKTYFPKTNANGNIYLVYP